MDHHQACVQHALERRAEPCHGVHHRLQDLAHDLILDLRRSQWGWAIGSHSAGIQARVAVIDPLVILRRRHRHYGVAVGERHDRQLLTVEKLFNQHLFAGWAEQGVLHGIHNRFLSLMTSGGNDDTFPLSQPVRLDHDRELLLLDIGEGVRSLFKTLGVSCSDLRLRHDLLREGFAGFQASGVFGRPKDFEPSLAKFVNNAQG